MRAAGPADAGGIALVHQASWRTTYTGILPLDVIAQHTTSKNEATWRARLADNRILARTFVVEDEGGVLGFANCGPARHFLEGLEAEIYALYVLQGHQRRGAGRALVTECAHHFVRNGLFGFYLWVLKANRARMFYEALGGAEAGEKSERLGLHSFSQVAYAWHDVTALIATSEQALPAKPIK